MANTLRFKRGLASGIPTALAGEPLFTTDTFDLYIGNGTTNTRFQKYIASGATTQILRGDGSLYTFPLAISSPSAGQVLKYNGTSWVNDSDAGITGSGAAGQVAYFTGATTQAGSNNLFWDATNLRLGLRTASPVATLEVSYLLAGSGLSTLLSNPILAITNPANWGYPVGIVFRTPMTNGGAITNIGSIWCEWQSDNNTFLGFATNTSGTVSEKMRLFATGNFGIGTGATDSGQRLQVIGDTLLKGSGNTSATTALTVQNSDGNNILRLRNDFTAIFDVAGSSLTISGIANYTILQANQAFYFRSNGATAGRAFKIFDNASSLTGTTGANQNIQSLITFAPTSGTATYTDLDLTSTINQTGGANGITRGLYVRPTLTAAADWRSIEWSNNSGWGLYGVGTANNYMAGSLGIGSTSLTGYNLFVSKNLTGSTSPIGIASQGAIQSDATSIVRYFSTTSSSQAATFTTTNLVHYQAIQGAFGAGHTVTNQYGFAVSSSLINGTNNYGFHGDIASGTNRWNLYMQGTADNYFAGNLGIGVATPSAKIDLASNYYVGSATTLQQLINKIAVWSSGGVPYYGLGSDSDGMHITSGQASVGNITFHTGGTAATMRLAASGNLLIGSTTDTGEKLQVTGTMKVTGATSFGNTVTFNGSTTYNSGAVLRADNGTAAAPSISFDSDLNTGIYRVSNDVIGFTTGGTEKMRLDNLGNLGLGVTPSAWGSGTRALQVSASASYIPSMSYVGGEFELAHNSYYNGTNWIYTGTGYGSTRLRLGVQGAFAFFTTGNVSGTAGGTATFTQAMTLDASGNLGLGTASPTGIGANWGTIDIRGASGGGLRFGVTSSTNFTVYANASAAVLTTTATIPIIFGNNNTERARFTETNGNLHIGTFSSDSGERLQVTGTAKITGASTFNGLVTISTSVYPTLAVISSNTIGAGMYLRATGTSGGYFTILSTASGAGQGAGKLVIVDELASATRLTLDGSGNLTVDTNTLFVDATNNRVGILTATPSTTLDVGGNATIGLTSTTGYSLVVQNSGANDTSGIRLTSGGTDNGYFITAYNSVSKYASLQAGDNTAYRNIVLNNLGGNVLIATNTDTGGGQKLQVNGAIRAVGNVIIAGGNALQFVNSSSNTVSAVRPTGGGTSVMSTNSNGLHIAVGTEAAGDLILASNNTERVRLSSDGWFSHISATNPSSSVTDAYVQYSADITAGNAAPHFRTENGAVVKIYQQTSAVGTASWVGGAGSTVTDLDTFDGYTIGQIVKALRNAGFLQ